jgi:hypothetical protein
MSTVIVPLTVIAIPIAVVLCSAFSRVRGQRKRIAALSLDSIRLSAALIVPRPRRRRRPGPRPDPTRVRRSLQFWNSVVLGMLQGDRT